MSSEFMMRDYLEEAADEIDAAIFSGDAFLDPKHRERLRSFMARWERGLKEHEEAQEEPCITEPEDG